MTAAAVDVEPDLSDLELLDDDKRHGFCSHCLGGIPQKGLPWIAVCGRRVISFDDPIFYIPENACQECVGFWRTHPTCPNGHVWGS